MGPARISSLLFGLLLAVNYNWIDLITLWGIIKLTSVICLFVIHNLLDKWRKDFESDNNTHQDKFYRVMNEVPTVFMILVVIFVVVKPG